MIHRILLGGITLMFIGIIWWITATRNPMNPGNNYHPYSTSAARFDLVDPQMAPNDIKPLVMQGFNIMLQTKKYVPEYAGDRLTCNSCHFSCGNTLGGDNGGISLVGVTHKYPKLLPGHVEYTLADRINSCFENSMNGKPMPVDGPDMKALITYLEWISHYISKTSKTPWLGLKALRSKHVPDPHNGQQVYTSSCALCHGKVGQGEKIPENLSLPPLWGDHSFNQKAGMNTQPILSSFIYYNMPFQQASLTVEEALDVAAFILTQPRPERTKTMAPDIEQR